MSGRRPSTSWPYHSGRRVRPPRHDDGVRARSSSNASSSQSRAPRSPRPVDGAPSGSAGEPAVGTAAGRWPRRTRRSPRERPPARSARGPGDGSPARAPGPDWVDHALDDARRRGSRSRSRRRTRAQVVALDRRRSRTTRRTGRCDPVATPGQQRVPRDARTAVTRRPPGRGQQAPNWRSATARVPRPWPARSRAARRCRPGTGGPSTMSRKPLRSRGGRRPAARGTGPARSGSSRYSSAARRGSASAATTSAGRRTTPAVDRKHEQADGRISSRVSLVRHRDPEHRRGGHDGAIGAARGAAGLRGAPAASRANRSQRSRRPTT